MGSGITTAMSLKRLEEKRRCTHHTGRDETTRGSHSMDEEEHKHRRDRSSKRRKGDSTHHSQTQWPRAECKRGRRSPRARSLSRDTLARRRRRDVARMNDGRRVRQGGHHHSWRASATRVAGPLQAREARRRRRHQSRQLQSNDVHKRKHTRWRRTRREETSQWSQRRVEEREARCKTVETAPCAVGLRPRVAGDGADDDVAEGEAALAVGCARAAAAEQAAAPRGRRPAARLGESAGRGGAHDVVLLGEDVAEVVRARAVRREELDHLARDGGVRRRVDDLAAAVIVMMMMMTMRVLLLLLRLPGRRRRRRRGRDDVEGVEELAALAEVCRPSRSVAHQNPSARPAGSPAASLRGRRRHRPATWSLVGRRRGRRAARATRARRRPRRRPARAALGIVEGSRLDSLVGRLRVGVLRE
mmetsp:Transcript_606/g.2378  ORF Transcript_606/g.2378 Transcript_606/m.2378 type:complete len:417 (+) Transcript_606:507-1757(+)